MAVLFACSSEEFGGVAENTSAGSAVNANSDVEISINTNNLTFETQSATRAGIVVPSDPIDLSVFMLAKNNLPGVTEENIDWSQAEQTPSVWLYNHKALANSTGLHWKSETNEYEILFYPAKQQFAYSFYAFHPMVEAAKITKKQDNISIKYDITGRDDIIAGVLSSDDEEAYSARYTGEKPTMTLEHIFTRLHFVFTNGGASGSGTPKDITVKSVSIETAKTITLNIKQNDPSNITMQRSKLTADVNMQVNDGAGNYVDMSPFLLTPGQKVPASSDKEKSYFMMLIPPPEGDNVYKLKMTLTIDGSDIETTPMDIKPDGDLNLEAGHFYVFRISIKSPTETTMSVVEEDWEDGEEYDLNKE